MADNKKPVDKEEAEREQRIKDENEKLEKKLRALGLRIIEIKPDRHCLYRAVESQLAIISGTGNSPLLTFQKLREMAASYMREHISDFMHSFMSYQSETYLREVERREVEGEPELPEVIGSMNLSVEVQFEKHCIEVEQTAAWGGRLELTALSDCLKKHIIVYSGSFPDDEMGEEYKSGHDSSIILSCHRHAYGLGKRYNSVVPNITG